MNPDQPLLSIVIPVKNEERILDQCLKAIRALDYPPELVEVIIADSLSSDRSREIAEKHGATVVRNERQTVASGRNLGFEMARGEFVAFTDADCVVAPDWLKSGLSAFRMDSAIAGVGGVTYFPDHATPFQEAVNTLFLMAGFLGATSHVQSASATEYVPDIPGCNAMYRRSALAEVMPVDERLLTAEDVWLNWLLRSRGYKHVRAERMLLWHHRRSNPRKFFHQIYRFAIGRLQAGKRERTLLKPVHVAAGVSLPAALVAAAVLLLAGYAVALPAVLLAGLASGIAIALPRSKSFRSAALFPVVVAIFLTAWSLGFLRELVFPLRSADGK
jgi:cellulose synthase/poly-beta-1,6-N-acetylglucosamine synthase-like glycosyltransferase